jgi:hypothetical protein
MPRTKFVGTIAPPGSGAQKCAQAGEREHITDSTTGIAATTAAWSSPLLSAYDGQRSIGDAICDQCGKPLPPTARRHARFCSPAHRAAHHRSSIAGRLPRVRFLTGAGRDNPSAMAPYVAIVPDTAFPGMYRLKRTDGSFSDMLNLTRARDPLAQFRGRP